jgi:hypothetical protein
MKKNFYIENNNYKNQLFTQHPGRSSFSRLSGLQTILNEAMKYRNYNGKQFCWRENQQNTSQDKFKQIDNC